MELKSWLLVFAIVPSLCMCNNVLPQKGTAVLRHALVHEEDAVLNVPQLIRKYGYPVEIHEVITPDGYILTIHRIPHGKKGKGAHRVEKKPVVLLQHGLMGDSSNWIINTEDKSLGYMLANAGYDVWMGNARGNTYSRRHLVLKPETPEFWNFSWSEMGKYDVPVFLDYILARTGQPTLHYVGHSMGSTMFWAAMIEHPQYNSKIKLMTAFAPLAYTTHMRSPLRALSPISDLIEGFLELFGGYEFLPNSIAMELLGAKICRMSNPALLEICTNSFFLATGFNSAQLNRTMVPVILGHSPAGTSTRAVNHYAQGVVSGKFQKFNHGAAKNIVVYGQPLPPVYDLSKVTCSVALFSGQNDWLATPIDVARLAKELPNVALNHIIKYDKFNHVDYFFSMNVNSVLNFPFMDFLRRY